MAGERSSRPLAAEGAWDGVASGTPPAGRGDRAILPQPDDVVLIQDDPLPIARAADGGVLAASSAGFIAFPLVGRAVLRVGVAALPEIVPGAATAISRLLPSWRHAAGRAQLRHATAALP